MLWSLTSALSDIWGMDLCFTGWAASPPSHRGLGAHTSIRLECVTVGGPSGPPIVGRPLISRALDSRGEPPFNAPNFDGCVDKGFV